MRLEKHLGRPVNLSACRIYIAKIVAFCGGGVVARWGDRQKFGGHIPVHMHCDSTERKHFGEDGIPLPFRLGDDVLVWMENGNDLHVVGKAGGRP